MLKPKRPQTTGVLRPERCPVCPKTEPIFGHRYFDKRKTWECKDCHADYTFHPYESKPTALTWKQKDNLCGKPCCEDRYKKGV